MCHVCKCNFFNVTGILLILNATRTKIDIVSLLCMKSDIVQEKTP